MRVYDIIKKKRDGFVLDKAEIEFLIDGYVKGQIPEYQMSAFLMAVYFRGMTDEETTYLTLAVRDSGEKADFSRVDGIRVDKHSTGGVGDKTSLVVTPIVASLGVKVAKMSGRGLGHTGGTIDKLESITGFNTTLSEDEFIDIVNRVGVAIVGQSKQLAPADKKLYALRDVTATVDSIPLIASSIMGKKLAADDDCIVLDVKTGSGSFMKTFEDSKRLATTMVNIGKNAGKKMLAVITDMDVPLGRAIGNSLEVIEAIDTLNGKGPKDFTELCLTLATDMLYLAGIGSREECRKKVEETISSGVAIQKFAQMVEAQGGDADLIYHPENFPKAKFTHEVLAPSSGYIHSMNTEDLGSASLMLGAGRNTLEDQIDYSAGIILSAKTGDYIRKGEVIATLYSGDKKLFPASEKRLLSALSLGEEKPAPRQLIQARIE